jgi:hypothetical protein
MRFSPKSFAQPDLLKSIQPENLLRLLEVQRPFFEDKGFVFPAGGDGRIDYLSLAGILAQPDESMDSDLVEAFHLIGNLGTDENFDALLDAAHRSSIDAGDGEATAPDLAARIWLADPQILERMERADLFDRRKKFESFRARVREDVTPIEALPSDFTELEQDLDGWFVSRKRGPGCKVIRKDAPGEVRLLVQHGQPCKREPSRKGRDSSCTFYRPERTDVIVYDFINNELRINASALAELKFYREMFGKHLFGDEQKFIYVEKYTLEPLKEQGEEALRCRDIAGMEWVRLTQIEYDWGGAFEHVEKHKAHDVFKALAVIRRRIEPTAEIRVAKFAVKLEGQRRPRSVLIRPRNIAEYGRGEEALIIEEWLRARGFVLVGSAAYAEAEPAVAGA